MQLDAIYDDGRLEFSSPVRFAHRRFRVRVDVPAEELIGTAPTTEERVLTAHASQWLRRLDAIRREVIEVPEGALPAPSDEQLERVRAIELREDR